MFNNIYPINIKPYSNPNKSQIDKDKENGESKSFTNQGDAQNKKKKRHRNFYMPFANESSDADNFEKVENKNIAPATINTYSPPPSTVTGTQSFVQPTVNIAQILADFKNTVSAIGTPPEIVEEINGYFSLIEKQSLNKNPNEQLIKSNLKNASLILDKYISDSLSKPSKVVENWIDTLFLQKVDFSYDEKKINPDFQLKFPQKKENTEPEQNVQPKEEVVEEPAQPEVQEKVYLPKDSELKKVYLQAKKYALTNNIPKALEKYQQALDEAVLTGDEHAQAVIYLEAAKIFDKKDLCAPALKNYYKATTKTKDYKIKTKAHYGMAKIYEDYVKDEPAMDHYFAALSCAGESENFAAQSASLANIGGICASHAQKREVRTYSNLAVDMAKMTKSPKLTGSVCSKVAKNYTEVGEPQKALSYYKDSAKQYKKINETKRLAKSFKNGAEIMQDLGKFKKAKNLYQKAYEQYGLVDDEKEMKLIFEQIANLKNLC